MQIKRFMEITHRPEKVLDIQPEWIFVTVRVNLPQESNFVYQQASLHQLHHLTPHYDSSKLT